MKHIVKIFALGAALIASSPLAHADGITGSIGFGGNGSYNATTNQFNAGSTIGTTGGNAYITNAGSGTLTGFTMFNAATFFSFNTSSLNPAAPVFTSSELIKGLNTTVSFKLTALVNDGTIAAGSGFSGTGILSETGYTDTMASFSLVNNANGGTFVTFNTATPAATPEPSSLMLLGTGLVSAAGMLVRRRRIV